MKQLLYALTFFLLSDSVKAQDSTFYFTTSDNVKLFVRTAGTGRPCLFLHGGPGNTSHYFEALPVAKLLEQKVKMIYFDQRGGGRSSSARDSNYSMQRMEQDIEELRASLKIKKWSVMGHSFGALIMTAYARDYPGNIRSLVYVHGGLNMTAVLESHIHYGLKLLKDVNDSFQQDTQLPLFDQMMKVHEELAKKGIEYKIMFRSQREKNIEDSLINDASPHFNQDFSHRVWKLKDYLIDYTTYTKVITCPVLIIAGKHDYAVGPGNYLLWQFKNAQVALYDGGHVSFQEEPGWFAGKVLVFLQNS